MGEATPFLSVSSKVVYLLGKIPVRHEDGKGQKPMELDPCWGLELNYTKGKGKIWLDHTKEKLMSHQVGNGTVMVP